MTRRIVIILTTALAILGLMFLLWFWFFSGSGDTETTGTFGTGEDATGTGRGGADTNFQDSLGTQGGTEGSNTVQTSIKGTAPVPEPSRPPRPSSPSIAYTGDYIQVPGVVWLDGSYVTPSAPPASPASPSPAAPSSATPPAPPTPTAPAGGTGGGSTGGGGTGGEDDDDETDAGGGAGVLFDPTDINDVTDATIRGRAYFNLDEKIDEDEFNAAFGIAGLVGACAAEFIAERTVILAGTKALGAAQGLFSEIPILGGASPDNVYDATNDANQITDNLLDCVVRALARAAIQAITAQTVSWINSGFEGKPAFVQNFNKFFTQVADQAAGEFIQGSALSFLCSPFQAQVKVAIAMSYAQRNVAQAQTCTMSDVVDNVEGFIDGNFNEGGWPGLISFTTQPSNNPFGAYMTAQARLNNQIIADTANAERKISVGGFLSREECNPPGSTNCKIVTPGSTIESALEATMKTNLDSLQLADSIDDIISALGNQLITKTLYEGLGNLKGEVKGENGRTPEEKDATRAAKDLLSELKAAVRYSEQYGAVQQGSIRDIQAVQSALTDLQNCYISHNNTSLANDVANRIAVLERRVTIYNDRILSANKSITRIQSLQTDALSATNKKQVEDVADKLEKRTDKDRIYSKEDVTTAQQDRSALQREMDTEERAVLAELTQCNAI